MNAEFDRLRLKWCRCLSFFAALTCALSLVLVNLSSASASSGLPVAVSVKATGDQDVTRLVLEFEGEVEISHQLLDHPNRLVLDFPKIDYGFSGKTDEWSGMVDHMRWGDMSDNVSRMIFDVTVPFAVMAMMSEADAERGLTRYFIDLEKVDTKDFAAEIDRTMKTGAITNTAEKTDRVGAPAVAGSSSFTVILDPGHGGIDTGAKGKKGTLEKDIVLEFAREMRDAINAANPAIQIFMTRDSDVFVPLDERVRFARQHNASLFISLHADSVRQDYVRGSTVYTISEKASDRVAAEIAESENSSDLVAGIEVPDQQHEVADILIDLTRRETLGFSVQFARLAVGEIKKVAKVINNPHRHAGFRVLRAHDVPSVLVEMGYLSNAEDEALLRDHDWRQSVADQLAEAVVRYAKLSGGLVNTASSSR